MTRIFPVLWMLAGIVCITFADRKLEPAETDQLLQTLTQQPRQSWLPYGMIEARHLQYQDFENKITDSTEIIYFDGQRYSWQVNLNPNQSLDMNSAVLPDSSQTQKPSEDFLLIRAICMSGTAKNRFVTINPQVMPSCCWGRKNPRRPPSARRPPALSRGDTAIARWRYCRPTPPPRMN